MECRHGNFWIGLGIGSILGAVAYRLSRTAKAKQLESDTPLFKVSYVSTNKTQSSGYVSA